MIKKFRNSLTVKIFCITFLLLTSLCTLTYSFIAWAMPISYNSNLNDKLTGRMQRLVTNLNESTLASCPPLLIQFVADTGATVKILDYSGRVVKSAFPWQASISTYELNVSDDDPKASVSVYPPAVGEAPTVSVTSSDPQYKFTFMDDKKPYSLMVIKNVRGVNQATEALGRVLPGLILAVLAISALGSLFYARYVTKPIVNISNISKRMANLEFDWYCSATRTDEIGILGRNLNELSERLSAALTELRDKNYSLQSDIEQEREMERRRLEFFWAVSHELKTPITVIRGQLEGMLKNIGVYRNRERYLARSISVTEQMEAIVQKILTVSRMESSEFALHRQETDFTGLVRQKLTCYADMLEQKALVLQTDLEPELSVYADSVLLQNVIDNLISNAVFYSPRGCSVRVRARRQKDGVSFSVENTGAHIPEESLPRLYEAFYRVEQSRNRRTGGSGLGLYLTKMILDRHGADYKMENTAEGVLFAFSLS